MWMGPDSLLKGRESPQCYHGLRSRIIKGGTLGSSVGADAQQELSPLSSATEQPVYAIPMEEKKIPEKGIACDIFCSYQICKYIC